MNCTTTTEFATAERASVETLEATQRSIASSAILAMVLDAMPQQVMILNRYRQIVYGNAAAMAMGAVLGHVALLGLRPGEMLACDVAGKAPSGCGTSEACRNCGAAQSILEAVAGHKADRECRISRAECSSAEALDLRLWATPFLWDHQDLVLLVATDIADEKRRQVLERVFFHDIMNTAGNISSMAEMLCTGDLLFDEIKEDLAIASDTLVQEIKSQRVLLSAESRTLAVQMAPLDSAAFLDSLVHTFRNHEVARGKRIRIAPHSTDCRFVSDEALLSRVIVNLLKNALEATARDGIVTLDCFADNAEVTFRCQNDAVLPREVQLQIFQRSFSTKGRDRGIGTYSIKLLTEKYLGGRVSFRSNPGTGTVFAVTLPQQRGQEG
jgi:signal transduction histidine kinase